MNPSLAASFPVMRNVCRLLLACSVLVLLLSPTAVRAQPEPASKPKAGKFLRVQRDDKGQPTALETAVVRYVSADGDKGVTVDLVSAVHVADRAYYEKLNSHMEQYDVLLYELVAPPGTRIPKGGKRDSGNPIAFLQSLMKSALRLESQTEQIDYTRKNFVHADLSPEQMLETMKDRGEDGWTLALGIAADMMRQQNLQDRKKDRKPAREEPELDLLTLFTDPESPIKLKRIMAEQFEEMDNPGAGLGPTLNNLLITDRNAAALKALQQEMAKGKKKIGIFYGAAHMPDFEKHLIIDFGLKRQDEVWITAWDLGAKKKAPVDLFKRQDN